MASTSTRGARKLEAALGRFRLGMRVRGARAIDVGASTGGFTEVLLAHGAASVTAIDVGHGQLMATLRDDARVVVFEKLDFKTLPLAIAPGPFDFFTVDVSFVAARSMLRGLAFRLRPGAEGVVLVKPQFELPPHVVRPASDRHAARAASDASDASDDRAADPAVRTRALAAFSSKATALGFEIVDHVDSPVPGGSGTVEVLAHLRFAGRTRALPQPGERRRTEAPRAAPPAASTGRAPAARLDWFAIAAPGLEGVVHGEVARLPGALDVKQVEGGVEFAGTLAAGMRANLELRVATRVLLRVGTIEARRFPELRRRLGKLPWRDVVATDRPLRVEAAASRCRLYHTGALAENVALALADALGPLPEGGAHDETATRVLVRGREDRFTVSVDSSGDLLHRRGWRVETGPAPLRETLAAGILRLAGHDPDRPLLDPMCGAGTIVLEACAIALDVAPGLRRSFAFEHWPAFDPAAWDRLRAEARSSIRDRPAAPIFAWDADPEAVATLRRNAERAGFLDHLSIEETRFGDRDPPAPGGLVMLNPPYGRRLPTPGGAARLLADIGRTLRRRFAGWRAAVLVPDTPAGRALALPRAHDHRLTNGGLRVRLVVTDVRRGGRPP